MALANDAILATAGSGATLATHSPGGSNTTEYQVVMPGNSSGFIGDTMPTYGLNIPQIGCAVNSYHWELFNHPSSGKTVTLRGLWPIPGLDVGNGVFNPERYAFYRTTAAGSGGTAATLESTTTTLANFFRLNPGDASLSSHISARTKLTSITTGAFLFQAYVSSLCSVRTPEFLEATHWNQLTAGIQLLSQRGIRPGHPTPPRPRIKGRGGSGVGAWTP